MKKQFMKININGKEVCINTLEYLGDEYVDGNILETFGNDDFVFYFEYDEIIDNHILNNGDGDFEWKTKTYELEWIEFVLDVENQEYVDISTELEEQITEICNQKFYKVEEL